METFVIDWYFNEDLSRLKGKYIVYPDSFTDFNFDKDFYGNPIMFNSIKDIVKYIRFKNNKGNFRIYNNITNEFYTYDKYGKE